MAKDWSNLKNQPKKADETEEVVDEAELDEEEAEAKAEAEETPEEAIVEETPAETKARLKAEAKAKADDEDESDDVYFVNSKTKNLATMVGEFKNGLFVAKNKSEVEIIKTTEDFQWWFIKELSKKEFDKLDK